MPAQRRQDDLLLARFPAAQRLVDALGHRVRGLRCGYDALAPGKTQARREALRLRLGHCLDQAELVDVRQQR